MNTTTTEAPTTMRRRSTDEAIPEDQLLADEIRVSPGARMVSFSQSGHEHKVDPVRSTVRCQTCRDAITIAAREGHSATEIAVSFNLLAEESLRLRQLASAAKLSLPAFVQRCCLEAVKAGEAADRAHRSARPN